MHADSHQVRVETGQFTFETPKIHDAGSYHECCEVVKDGCRGTLPPVTATIVQKYGGSSLSDLRKVEAVADRVVARKRAGTNLVVVVSAMGDTTDELLQRARQISAEPPRRELDMLLTVGERTSMALLSMAIQARGEQAISFTGSQCGVMTTDSHARARIMEVRPFRVQDELEKGRIVIVAGYQGTSYKREITTLGRGGSDLTAVALAGALEAEACEIYSDVDGVLTADPRVVPAATRIETLSHLEMEELSRGGARVLHRDAVAWARRAGVALYAKSTFDPESKGTAIRVNPPPRPTPVVAVTGRKDLIAFDAPTAAAVESALGDTPIQRRGAGASAVRWIVATEDLPEADALCAAVAAAGGTTTRPLGSVTVVGSGLGEDRAAYDAIVHAFTGHPSELSSVGWTAWMSPQHVDSAVKDLHRALLEG